MAAGVDAVSWIQVLLCLFTVVGVQAGANYANDYFDGVKGTDNERVGPVRLVAAGLAPPRQVLIAAIISLGVATIAGITVALLSSPWLLVLGVVCLIAAWTYTGGPKPYAYRALGEVMVFLFFGPVAVTGIAYVQIGSLDGVWLSTLAAGIGVGVLTAAVMLTNNLRDIDTDAASGKVTLAGILGQQNSRRLYVVLLAVAVVCLGVLVWTTTWLALFGLGFLLFAIPAARKVMRGARDEALIPVLAQTGRAELVWGLGIFVGAILG